MLVDIKVPAPGESISEVEIGKWLVENGSVVRKDQELAEVESDKATLSLIATAAGQLSILASEGDRVNVGSVACTIDTDKASSQPAEIPVVAAFEQKKPTQNTQIEKDTKPIVAEQKLSVPKE